MRNTGPQAPDPLAASAQAPWGAPARWVMLRLPFSGQRKESIPAEGRIRARRMMVEGEFQELAGTQCNWCLGGSEAKRRP